MKNISVRYGGYRMGIFIVAIFLLLIGYLSISIAKISGEKANEIKKSLENNKENLTDLLDLYTRQLEYGKKDFKQRASDK